MSWTWHISEDFCANGRYVRESPASEIVDFVFDFAQRKISQELYLAFNEFVHVIFLPRLMLRGIRHIFVDNTRPINNLIQTFSPAK